MTLIDELYSTTDIERIKLLYSDDDVSKKLLVTVIGSKIVESEKILVSSPLDILYFICSLATFADSEEECQYVAATVLTRIQEKNPLPYILDDRGIVLAEKTLIALSFFNNAMIYRAKYKGAPKPSFYREYSKKIFTNNSREDVAEHHEQWEAYLSEMFLC